jgi:polyphenol oxidase
MLRPIGRQRQFRSSASVFPSDCDYTGSSVAPTKTSPRKRGFRKPRSPAASANAWTERTSNGTRILQVPALNKLPWLVHGFSSRPGGVSALAGRSAVAEEKVEQVLNLGFAEWDSRENVLENRRRFQSALGARELALVSLKQFHSDVVHVFETAPAEPCQGDASATNRPSLLLGVQTADCVPILLVDPRRRAVAAVHAGWRGTLQRIVMKAIGKMQMEFATNPADLLAALGPAIGGCCYEVGTEVASAFLARFPNAAEWFDELRTGDEPNPLQWLNMMPPGHQPPAKNVFLDLRKANRAQLLDAGLSAKNIFVSDLCTACRLDLLFSYRKEGAQSGRLLSVIGIRPS